MQEASGPVEAVFNSYGVLFEDKVVSESFVLGVRMLVGAWMHELLSWRNLSVSNYDDGTSILLAFSDQSYESSQTYYPRSTHGTVLYDIDLRMNNSVVIPIEMLETIEKNGLKLRDNQDQFKQ